MLTHDSGRSDDGSGNVALVRIMEDTPFTLGDGLIRLAQEVVSDVAMAYGANYEQIEAVELLARRASDSVIILGQRCALIAVWTEGVE